MAKIAFLGTGLLGAAFAEAAAGRGDTVTAWNRSSDKLLALAPFGVTAAATPAQAVRDCTRVHLVLKDDDVVEEVLAAARPAMASGVVIIDHTTTLPERTAARAALFAAQGLKYLHCPVFMGPPAARKALGSMMVAGPQAVFDEVKADLAKMTGRLEYVGARTDLAAVKKLCGNAAIIGVSALLADILTIAQASGVSGEDAIGALGLFDLNTTINGRGMNMARGNFDPSFELTMARKDVRLMIETAGARPMAALPAIAARMDQLIAAGYGARDASVLGIDAVSRP
jgi:3-hydroxyisobutyrate dehydrogenase-like beta-hydroxyacid dehydrogenase